MRSSRHHVGVAAGARRAASNENNSHLVAAASRLRLMPFAAMRRLRVPAREGLCTQAGLQLAKQAVCHAGQRHPGKRSVYKSGKFLPCHAGLQRMSFCDIQI